MLRIGSQFRYWAVAALLALVVVGGTVLFWPRDSVLPNNGSERAGEDDLDLPVNENPGYVGMQACAPCHAARLAQFLKTNHFLACREPRPGEMPEGFQPGHGTFTSRVPGLRFEMTQAGSDFLHSAVQTLPSGEDKRASTRIAWVYGAGDADEVFFGWHGDRLYELPASWLHPQHCWGIGPPYRYSRQEDFSREATTRCVECHNTWIGYVPGTLNQYRREGAILGVTCERCHGPGRDHVAFHQAHPDAETAAFIVNPARLSRERQMDACAQCHSNAIHHRAPPFSYRPGQPLDESIKTLSPKHPEDDRVANQTHYLRQSKCFQKSEMTCVTCHNPHRPKSPEATATVQKACLKCHQPADCPEQPRLPTPVRGDCASCHMPKGVKINVHFHTEDDEYVAPILRSQHRIGIYPAARQAVLLAWYRTQTDSHGQQEAARLARELVAYWQAEAEKCRRAYRFTGAIAALREALRIESSPELREQLRDTAAVVNKLQADSILANQQVQDNRIQEAIATYQRILQVKPDDATAHGRLGMLYATTGQEDKAVQELLTVARCDPDEPYGYAMLGWMKYKQGNSYEAVEYFRQAEAIEPFQAVVHHHWGLALLQLGQPAEAEQRLRRAVAIDPQSAGAYQALAIALRRQSKAEQAIPFARRAARLTNYQNPDILVHLAEAYADARRPREADDAVAKALDAARHNHPDQLPAIHARREEIRRRAEQPPAENGSEN